MTIAQTTASLTDLCGEVIHGYSRADALADGTLYEVPAQLAAEAGFRIPVALTIAAWIDCVAWSEEDELRKGGAGQDETGRLWDVLHMTRLAISRTHNTHRAIVALFRVPREGKSVHAQEVQLVAHIGPGDHNEPVLTIMQPYED